MEQTLLKAKKRETMTKSALKTERKNGFIPAIMYGVEEKPTSIFVNNVEIKKLLKKGSNVLVKLNIDGMPEKSALVKEVQKDVISTKLLHVDFHIISLKDKLEVEVPIHVVGEAPGVKTQGGVLSHVLREITIKCLPTEIPQFIEADISNLNMGESVTLKDINISPNFEVLSALDSIIVSIVAPMKEEVVAAPEQLADTAAEPEVISKGKKETEEEAAAAATAPEKGKTPAKEPEKKG